MYVRFKVLTAASMKMTALIIALMMEAVSTSEASAYFCKRRNA
jgi:hypothetical protein